jgi:NAD(P)-dependent dehydrogenase (short-subunit alcohol dehydrogenase family)
LSLGLPDPGDHVTVVSRSRPPSLATADGVERQWLAADLGDPAQAASLGEGYGAAGHSVLDVLVCNAGMWEAAAFSRHYRFANSSASEIQAVLALNLTGVVLGVQAMLPYLRRSSAPRLVLIGSVNGLENTNMPEVAYNASKFGLRGAAHGLRASLRADNIPVTVINPGSFDDFGSDDGRVMPASDIVDLIRCIVRLSNAACVKEIDMPALLDQMA